MSAEVIGVSFAALAEQYDAFIIDIWGVIHDGVKPYPGAIECLTCLRQSEKSVVLLSNAPRRAEPAAAAMRQMGIADNLYNWIVTSGEVTHVMLRDRTHPLFARLGRRVFHLGPERDKSILNGLDLQTVPDITQADFILNTGPDDHRDPTDITEFEPDLAVAAAAALPMVCANPDLEVIRNGRRILCAGALALRYQELGGGEVVWVGKPDPLIYLPILDYFDKPPSRILVVGDSLRTDIAGAKAIGVDSCWVLGGIHRGSVDPAAEAVARGLSPVAVIRSFRW
jgi:HAD superfamily hydrolase (TIGR01459 family)